MAITVTIDGVNRTSLVVFNSVKKKDNLNQQVDALSLRIRKYGTMTYTPTVGDEIVVADGASNVFGGAIVRITERVVASKILEYDLECADYSFYLKRKLVTERYEGMTAEAVIDDIIATYASDFTTTNVIAIIDIESVSFNRLTVAECLQKIADALSYVWYVDYDQDIHFFAKNTELAPYDITDTSSNYLYNSLAIVEDISQIKNSVLVQGGEAESDATRTELFSGDGTKTTFPMANKFSETPTILVGTSAQTVGIDFLDDDGSFDVMWNFNEKYIRFTAGNIPGSGTNNISVTAKYLFPIVVRVPSPASIAEFGTYEFAITDKSIVSQDEAIDRALAELQSYQNQLYEGSFKTYTSGLRSGQVINIASTQRGKDIDVLIQSVEMRMRDPVGTNLEFMIEFVTLKTVGIIEYLQKQLRDREIIIDDDETLLNFIPLTDTFGFTDTIDAPVTQTGPYVWSNDAGTTPKKMVWNFFVWG